MSGEEFCNEWVRRRGACNLLQGCNYAARPHAKMFIMFTKMEDIRFIGLICEGESMIFFPSEVVKSENTEPGGNNDQFVN